MNNNLTQIAFKIFAVFVVCLVAAVYVLQTEVPKAEAKPEAAALRTGPFISDPKVMEKLDYLDPKGDCSKSGPLAFPCLIQQRIDPAGQQVPSGERRNPFNLAVNAEIRETIRKDLESVLTSNPDDPVEAENQLHPEFLTDPDSRFELVGITNRMDRKTILDPVAGAEDHERCGEIFVIYRFKYSLKDNKVSSRLPVTMNIVFPAIPRNQPGLTRCQDVAKRWVDELANPEQQGPDNNAVEKEVSRLLDPDRGVIAPLRGQDIERLEMNMQIFRIPASNDKSDLGSSADYVIRVFRWHPPVKRFTPSFLTNQIDRARILGNPLGDDNSCQQGTPRRVSKREFLQYLLKPVVLSDIDSGALNIPIKFLACRAISGSPGGPYRSKNNLFWNAPSPAEQIVTDREIMTAMARAKTPRRQFSYMDSPDDFRLRLSEQTCTGCHQARAIAGFHFPGSDREGTPVSNAVYLPGSPHFYGDQPRRIDIITRLAAGKSPSNYEMAPAYSSRPEDRFPTSLAHTQLIGGWGGACMFPDRRSKRQWDCQDGLECKSLFKSGNAPNLGTCVPAGRTEIGDALQTGKITSAKFGRDVYLRTSPPPTGDWSDRDQRDTRIADNFLPKNPENNSYFGSHQEFYKGVPAITGTCADAIDPKKCYVEQRDRLTGGFSAGMLRLSECIGLPDEATCALIATSGFNACLTEAAAGNKTLIDCFGQRTSYAGVRACDIDSPCRDDYICLRPLGYNAENGLELYNARFQIVKDIYSLKARTTAA